MTYVNVGQHSSNMYCILEHFAPGPSMPRPRGAINHVYINRGARQILPGNDPTVSNRGNTNVQETPRRSTPISFTFPLLENGKIGDDLTTATGSVSLSFQPRSAFSAFTRGSRVFSERGEGGQLSQRKSTCVRGARARREVSEGAWPVRRGGQLAPGKPEKNPN